MNKRNLLFLTVWTLSGFLSYQAFADDGNTTEIRTLTPEIEISKEGVLTTSLSPIWELQLSNEDANQNQSSMAVANGYIYMCVDYYSGEKKGKLFIRRYACDSGQETEFLIDFQDLDYFGAKYPHSFPFVVSDDSGSLYVAQASEYDGKFHINYVEIDQATMTLKTDVIYNISKEMSIQKVWMERISDVKGDLKSTSFEFKAVFAGIPPQTSGGINNYANYLLDCHNGKLTITLCQLDYHAQHNKDRNILPSIAYHPIESDVYAFSGVWYIGSSYTWMTPEIRNDVKGEKEIWLATTGKYCRGFCPFIHNGKVYGVYASTNAKPDGCKFSMVKWEEERTITDEMRVASFPAVAFAVNEDKDIYHSITQLAVAKDATPVKRTSGETVTNLYVCSPGAGIAAYALKTVDSTPTSISDLIESDKNGVEYADKCLKFNTKYESQVVSIYNVSGNHIADITITDGVADLNELSAGFYVAVTPAGTYKICR